MLQQQQLIGNLSRLPLLDEPLLQLQRVGVGDETEALDLEFAHFAGGYGGNGIFFTTEERSNRANKVLLCGFALG
jgi:hypothetical protein